jgi:CheY-like chemotaxis protein
MWALVIEDDAHSLDVISKILRDQGIEFKRNTTGANVLQQLHKMQPQPDFILLDIDLPQANPFDIAAAIHGDHKLRKIPIICLGEGISDDLVERAQQSGCHSFLSKPLPRHRFPQMLRKILNGEHFWALAV